MKFLNMLNNKFENLNVHKTDTYQVCPHCNKRVHITKCRMPSVDMREATHYESLEGASKTLTGTILKLAGTDPIIARLFGEYAGPKAQRGVEETAHLMRTNLANLKKRETICPNCGKSFLYTADSISKW